MDPLHAFAIGAIVGACLTLGAVLAWLIWGEG